MRPLLVLHGFTGAPSSFSAALDGLGPLAALRAPYLVGHGRPAAAPEVSTFTEELARLASFLDASEPAVVVGYSLGARLALGLTLSYPERVHATVLISGNAGVRSDAERAERLRRDEHLATSLERDGLERFVDDWEKEPLFATQSHLPPALQREERARRSSHTPAGLARSLRVTGLAVMPNYWPELPRIAQPVQFLAGERDPRFCDFGRALVGELPRGELTIVQDAGHNLLIECPSQVAEAMRRALNQ